MNPSNRFILSTSPLSQPARNPRETVSLARRQRLLYGRERRYSTGKERDTETGLHYYGARYLDGRTGRWISGDPAVGEYIPSAPADDGARKRNGNLPGQGGVFNYANLHLYHYAGNNPVKYTDPNGSITKEQHLNRNQYQNGYAPANRERMNKLVAIGLFVNEGNTGTHNLSPSQNNKTGRGTSMIPHGTNIDYRGEIGTIFEGMQFIYNAGGDIVLDSVNKGTFDYRSPLKSVADHFSFDIQPWIEWGNGPAADKKEDVIMNDEIWSRVDGILNLYNTGKINREQARELIQSFFSPPPPVPQDLAGGVEK